MSATISTMERIRITIDVSDRCRRALGIVAARTTKSPGELVEQMIEATYPDDIAIADRSIAGHPPKKSKRGRPAKPKP